MSVQIVKVFSNIIVPDFMLPAVATHTFHTAGPQTMDRILRYSKELEARKKAFIELQGYGRPPLE